MVVQRKKKNFKSNESGQIAVATAILAVPLLLVISIAIDSNRSHSHRVKLQSALDSAALAAVADQTLTERERNLQAEERFWANMSGENGVKFGVVDSKSNQVEVQGKMMIPTIFAGLIGHESVEFSAKSSAEIVKGSTVCMLALDPDSGRSFEVTRGASLDANCTVQVNSRHEQASVVDHGGMAKAQSFCIGGGIIGEHFPFVNTECSTLADPYQNMFVPRLNEPCVDQQALLELIADWRSGRDAVESHEAQENQRWAEAKAAGQPFQPTFFEKNHLQPGNYCEGLVLNAKEFILDPGVYNISSGSLVFGLGTELIGKDVTFVLHDDVNIEIRDGSILNIKSPNTGDMKGLVIAQNLKNKSIYDPRYPNVKSVITSGASLNLLGTVYLPSHKIEFLGGSLSKTHAPATSFIAHQISVNDGANISVSADHIAAGTIPIEPRSDGGVRLIK